MRALLKDRSFGQALAKKIQETCPGPAKKPAEQKEEGAAAGPDGSFKGNAKGLKGFSAAITLIFKQGKLNRGIANISGASWPLNGSLKGDKLTVIGKRGNDHLTLKGTLKGKRITGNFNGTVGGAKQQGSWQASK